MTSRPLLNFGTAKTAVRSLPIVVSPPKLLSRDTDAAATPMSRRRRIWELSRHLHCSVVGTCLSTGELRYVLAKAGRKIEGLTEHDLHGLGVLAAGRRDIEGTLLNKALEKRHQKMITAFRKATTDAEVLLLWRQAVQQGEIPGAYWAALTHQATTDALVKLVFGEVHMLSHLVGSANRADIRRLSDLEATNAELLATIDRQQRHLKDGLVTRDARISALMRQLECRIAQNDSVAGPFAADSAALEGVVADQARRLEALKRRSEAQEQRIALLDKQVAELSTQSALKTDLIDQLQSELAALEAKWETDCNPDTDRLAPRMADVTILYVGGLTGSISHFRRTAATAGATLLSHDGGIDERSGALCGLIARADVVLFPVDCVSHEAAVGIKRACRKLSKPFVALRSSGLSSFVVALRQIDAKDRH